tara:strand:- start:7238 stop:9454 length:2217 start_codon:yes stop_codon:yes gene_type:complete
MPNNFDNVTWLLNEERVKQFITSLYDGIEGSGNNARILASDYNTITESSAEGKDTAYYGILKTKDYLENMELLVKNEADFERQFQFPVKCTAQFRADVLEIDARHVTDLDGWIFAISDSFSDAFNVRRKTLSVIFPEICAAVSIRMKEESVRHVEREMQKFSGVLPIPFVNRAMHKDCLIERIGGVPEPEKLCFLMTSMADVESLRTTICFENYCDIVSRYQLTTYRRGYLGAPVILSGIIVDITGSQIIIQSHDRTQITFQLGYQITCQQGQHVAVLASIFYGQSHPASPPPEYPEIFHLWEITEGQTREFDEIGHKRLRGDASTYDTAVISDPIKKMFVDCSEMIRQKRENYAASETSIIDFDILSAEAISETTFASFLKKDRGRIYKMILVYSAELFDSKGIIQKKKLTEHITKFHSDIEEDMVRRRFGLMIDFGLIEEFEGEVIRPTKKGYNVLSIIKDTEVESSLSPDEHGVIDLTKNLSCKSPSLLLQKIKHDGKHEKIMECDAFWIEKGKFTPEIEEEIGVKIFKIGDKIIQALAKIPHHGNADKVFMEMEEPKENYFSVSKILEYLAGKKHINIDEKKGYYVNDKDKLQGYLKNEKRFCRITEIYDNTSIRHQQNTVRETEELIENLAENLVGEGIASSIEFPSGVLRYAICDGDCEKEKIDFFCMVCRKGMFAKKKTWDIQMGISQIRGIVTGSVKDSVATAERVIQKNIDEGFWEIVEDGVVLRQKKG